MRCLCNLGFVCTGDNCLSDLFPLGNSVNKVLRPVSRSSLDSANCSRNPWIPCKTISPAMTKRVIRVSDGGARGDAIVIEVDMCRKL